MLTEFIVQPDVREMLKPFRPPPPRKLGVSLKVPQRATKFDSSVCGAFDYLFRFELERRVPHLINRNPHSDGQWVAERALTKIRLNAERPSSRVRIPGTSPDDIDTITTTLTNARAIWKEYTSNNDTNNEDKTRMAICAIKLSKLDVLIRVGQLYPDYDFVDSESVSELLELLSIVPWEVFTKAKQLLLNPTFQGSSLVGGADGDLIVDDMLVDIKTTIKDEHNTKSLDQLLGYYLLANHFPGAENASFDELSITTINSVALYYSRHGYLWSLPTSFWTDKKDEFAALKEWFFKRADKRDRDPLPKRRKMPLPK